MLLHKQEICSSVKLEPLLFPPKLMGPEFTKFDDKLPELHVVSSCGYLGLPLDVGVRFCEWGWWLIVNPDIGEPPNCPIEPKFRCTIPIWLLQSLFGDDSWSEQSDILGYTQFFNANFPPGTITSHHFSSTEDSISGTVLPHPSSCFARKYNRDRHNTVVWVYEFHSSTPFHS